uniref:Uncharacterized protein n=1 Tax=Rhizophora mucronata TaxID=61149 RepID=A0A2P2QCK2_RHIMU
MLPCVMVLLSAYFLPFLHGIELFNVYLSFFFIFSSVL